VIEGHEAWTAKAHDVHPEALGTREMKMGKGTDMDILLGGWG
jgi:hypothetical protein